MKTKTKTTTTTLDAVKNYYGKVLQTSKDLRTDACCSIDDLSTQHKRALADVHPEVMERFYGCGSPMPEALEGCTVLDLGCGTGRDSYAAAKLVGRKGHVIGVDMTEEQLDVARRHQAWHTERFGYPEDNTRFLQGYIEDLAALDLGDDSVDVVISNCVVNLSPNKPQVFSEIARVLKPGGELHFADVFASRRIPEALKDDPVLYGECLAGALYLEDLRRELANVGLLDARFVTRRKLQIDDAEVAERLGMIDFFSMTVRAFAVPGQEDRAEDYGQVAIYRGNANGLPHGFVLDENTAFETGRPTPISGNTAAILAQSRLAPLFDVVGDRSTHFGLFTTKTKASRVAAKKSSCC